MLKRICLFGLIGTRSLLGWGCEGHQIVALIAEKNLTPHALEQVKTLLSENAVDPNLVRFCAEGHDDALAEASTWADDARRGEGTGKWHYMDIPRQVTGGDANKNCESVGPANERGERSGCVLSAIIYNRAILKDAGASPAEKAKALRYLIHFVGDLHQPLHTTDNLDQGGNCTAMVLLDSPTISNLHSIWDSGLLERYLHNEKMRPPQVAARLNQKFSAEKAKWAPTAVNPETWVWESHAAGNETTFGAIQPAIPLEPVHGKTDCNAETQKVYALHIHLGNEYLEKSIPVINEQLTKAGFRLAEMLNAVWP